MTKTICDRCGKEIHVFPIQIETGTFFITLKAELCKECHKELLDWLDGAKKDEPRQSN